MAVYHIMKDGRVLTDITGHVVRLEDAEPVYRLLDEINRGKRKTNIHKNEKKREVRI